MSNKLFRYLDFEPVILQGVFIAPTAVVIGRTELNENVNIWFNTVIRGDVNNIKIGKNTNVQDLSMLHITEQNDLIIGENVSIGHSVILHGCNIGNGCLIGMGSKILDGAIIGNNCLVAAGSVIPPNKKYPDNSFIIGAPAVVKRTLSEEEIQMVSNHYKSYIIYKDQYLADQQYR